jgi:riboflavin synthase alpha subunit
MFTGLIEDLGEVTGLKATPAGFRLRVRAGMAGELAPGDSLAVNGVCLTVTGVDRGELVADVSPETARVTSLGLLKPGAAVNLERPVRADGRMGGHFVQGHVDATGTIEGVREDGNSYRIAVRFPPVLAPFLVNKGSVAVDGISLTIASLGDRQFDVQIVPFTWEHTNLRTLRAGDAVNIECDILGKYVARITELSGLAPEARTESTPD